MVPTDRNDEAYFCDAGKTRFSQIEKQIEKWKLAESIGVVSPEIFAILNTTFKEHYVGESTTEANLDILYERAARRVSKETGITEDSFKGSPVIQRPL